MAAPLPVEDHSAAHLECNHLIAWTASPFPLPAADDLAFLLDQHRPTFVHKDIGFDPATGRFSGARLKRPADQPRLAGILKSFSDGVTSWLATTYPGYATGLTRDRVTLRTDEEATRAMRLMARNDLLRVDNFPTRPTFGRRILRIFANINPTDPQVWAVSEAFPQLLARYVASKRIPPRTREQWIAPTRRLFGGSGPSAYDVFMQRLHHHLKEDDAFQGLARRRVLNFPPGSAWALFVDGLSNAQLRGRYSLEHSFFIDTSVLEVPEEAPIAVLSKRSAG